MIFEPSENPHHILLNYRVRTPPFSYFDKPNLPHLNWALVMEISSLSGRGGLTMMSSHFRSQDDAKRRQREVQTLKLAPAHGITHG